MCMALPRVLLVSGLCDGGACGRRGGVLDQLGAAVPELHREGGLQVLQGHPCDALWHGSSGEGLQRAGVRCRWP